MSTSDLITVPCKNCGLPGGPIPASAFTARLMDGKVVLVWSCQWCESGLGDVPEGELADLMKSGVRLGLGVRRLVANSFGPRITKEW